MQIEKLLTVQELSKTLGISKVTIYGWIAKKRVPYYKIGHRVYFKISDIYNSLDKYKIKAFPKEKKF